MIKINLLETAKANKRGGSSGPSMPTMEMGDLGSPKLKVLVILLIAGAVIVWRPEPEIGRKRSLEPPEKY